MKIGIGLSKLKEPEDAIAEAYRKSLQKLGATKSDFTFIAYSYDYGMDLAQLGSVFKKVLRYVPHLGCSAWSAWTNREGFEAETGLMVMSIKDPSFNFDFFKVNSLREKAELWSAEIRRQMSENPPSDFVFVFADSLNFQPGNGFSDLEKNFPETQFGGVGTSFSVPQCSIVLNGEVYMNALLALSLRQVKPWMGIFQSVLPELNPVTINRMSENLIIEVDNKPAFYKLSEHLMAKDDLPMMSPDEFRKHMGNLYLIETPKVESFRERVIGSSYRVIPLLGSEMTTGMVAVAQTLDFGSTHYLGQKKAIYADENAEKIIRELKEKIEKPSMIWMFLSSSRLRDRERKQSDLMLVQEAFPDVPIFGMTSNAEYIGTANQYAGIVIAFP